VTIKQQIKPGCLPEQPVPFARLSQGAQAGLR
jgi:hypothetical protein